jgi:CubicO group peptidase (beta-lactamase class C family)
MTSKPDRRFSRRELLKCTNFGAAIAATGWHSAATARLLQPTPAIIGVTDRVQKARVATVAQTFMQKYKIPGLQLAMAYRGKLKLVACFGMADQENRLRVEPKHVFRIASVSKPVTGTTVMKLVEQGVLKLSDRVFGKDGHLKNIYDTRSHQDVTNRRRLEQITVQHLLEHTAGGWGNKRNDPMFASQARRFNHQQLIAWTLDNMRLQRRPGEAFDYSNFGYCLVGRVIESVTEKTYEDAVQELLLRPAGISKMAVARNNRKQRLTDEVNYYGQGDDPYGQAMDVRRMDSHGGWVASAIDLVRLAVHVDGFKPPADLLSESTIRDMTTPSSPNLSYASGWSVNSQGNWWHQGGFNGGSSILARINDGHAWAVVVNTRSSKAEYSGDLDQFPWQVRQTTKKWGNHNLFQKFR